MPDWFDSPTNYAWLVAFDRPASATHAKYAGGYDEPDRFRPGRRASRPSKKHRKLRRNRRQNSR